MFGLFVPIYHARISDMCLMVFIVSLANEGQWVPAYVGRMCALCIKLLWGVAVGSGADEVVRCSVSVWFM